MGTEGLRTMAVLAALLGAVPAVAQMPDATMLTASSPQQIAQLVRDLGRPATLETDEAGDPSIETGFAGFPGRIWFFDCDVRGRYCLNIRLQIGIVTEGKLSLAQVNAFNQERRFATLSLDEEGDPILAYDLSMTAPGISAAVFRATFRAFDAQAAELVRMAKQADDAPRAPRKSTEGVAK